MDPSGIDHSTTERWLLYGHDLSRAFSPLQFWLTVLAVTLVILVLMYIIREFDVIARLRRRPVRSARDTLEEQQEQLQQIKTELAEVRAGVASVEDAVVRQAGELAGAVDVIKDIVRESVARERESIRARVEDCERIERADANIREALSRMPHAGSG